MNTHDNKATALDSAETIIANALMDRRVDRDKKLDSERAALAGIDDLLMALDTILLIVRSAYEADIEREGLSSPEITIKLMERFQSFERIKSADMFGNYNDLARDALNSYEAVCKEYIRVTV